MGKVLSLIMALALALPLLPALGETAVFAVTTDQSVQGVALMDENGQTLSTVVGERRNGATIDWTLRITDNGASQAVMYTKDANGNWLCTQASYELSWFFSGGQEEQSQGQEWEAPAKPWPEEAYQLWTVEPIPLPESERYQSRCGPSREYHGAGAYKTYKMTSTQALFVEGSYVLVDLSYTTVGNRRVYFQTKNFTGLRNVPQVQLRSYAAATTRGLTPRFGPGVWYDAFDEAAIGPDTPLAVFFEEDGWVFAEFNSPLGWVRAWIPADQAEAR